MNDFTDEMIEIFLRGIYSGRITTKNLPPKLYFAIADYMKRGLYEGFGIDFNSLTEKIIHKTDSARWNNSDLKLLTDLRENIYLFSGAKTYQEVRTMGDLMIGEDGKLKPFSKFFADGTDQFDLYNRTWAKTEYQTCIGQGQSAEAWNRIEKEKNVLPLLKYSAILDGHTSDICRPLDGIIAPVGDPIWKKIAPLNHFNCRCLLIQLSEGEATDAKTKAGLVNGVLDKMDDLFKMNPGQSGYVFSEKHPYFDVAPKDKAQAENNFNLPIPKRDASK